MLHALHTTASCLPWQWTSLTRTAIVLCLLPFSLRSPPSPICTAWERTFPLPASHGQLFWIELVHYLLAKLSIYCCVVHDRLLTTYLHPALSCAAISVFCLPLAVSETCCPLVFLQIFFSRCVFGRPLCLQPYSLIGSFVHWLIDWLLHWFSDSLIDSLIISLIDPLIHWLLHWFSDLFIDWFTVHTGLLTWRGPMMTSCWPLLMPKALSA